MKSIKLILSSIVVGGLVLSGGCEWSSGGDENSYNTSQGAGVDYNMSGFYEGSVSSRPISNLVISQTGNRLQVTDNNGSGYTGSVGAPGNVTDATTGSVRAGTTLVQFQVSWEGVDNSTGGSMTFEGVMDAVTENDTSTTMLTKTGEVSNGGVTTQTWTSPVGANPAITQTVTITGEHTETSTTSTYTITEDESQGRLRGTWIYEGGSAHALSMTSPGGYGTMTTTTTSDF